MNHRKPQKSRKIRLTEKQQSIGIVVIITVTLFVVLAGMYLFGYHNGYKVAETKAKQAQSQRPSLEGLFKNRNPLNTITGRVIEVKKDSLVMDTVQGKRQEMLVAEDVKITKKAQNLKLTDIKTGQKIVVFQAKNNDKPIATRIVIQQ